MLFFLIVQGLVGTSGDLIEDRLCGTFVVLDTAPQINGGANSIEWGDPTMDLVVGITTFSNNSLGNYGNAGGIVFVSFIRDWIDPVTSLEVMPWRNALCHSLSTHIQLVLRKNFELCTTNNKSINAVYWTTVIHKY